MKRYDVYTLFARRHLATREERAVYLTLVSQQHASWSAHEIAKRNRLDEHDVERVLDDFQAAAIVEEDGPSKDGPRYRWRSDMSYLFAPPGAPATETDPVCGMPVLPDTPYVAPDTSGEIRRFCSSLCRAAFMAFPNTFAPQPANARGVDARSARTAGAYE